MTGKGAQVPPTTTRELESAFAVSISAESAVKEFPETDPLVGLLVFDSAAGPPASGAGISEFFRVDYHIKPALTNARGM